MARLSAPSEGVHFASRSRPGSGTRSDSLAQQHGGHAGRFGLSTRGRNRGISDNVRYPCAIGPPKGLSRSSGSSSSSSGIRGGPGAGKGTRTPDLRSTRVSDHDIQGLYLRLRSASGPPSHWSHTVDRHLASRAASGRRQRVACALVALAFRYDGRDIERARPVRRA